MVKRLQTKKLMFSKTAMMLLFVLLTSATAWAAEGDVVDSGTCGDNLTWTLTENGEADFTYDGNTYTPLTLTITGTGHMRNYGTASNVPWYNNCIAITHLELPEGMTNVGKNAFCGEYYVQSVTLPASVSSIGENAFRDVGIQCSAGCTFTAAKGSNLMYIYADAFYYFGGNVDLRNCTSLHFINAKVFEEYKSHTITLPTSMKTIEKNALYSKSSIKSPKVRVAYNNSAVYVNGKYKYCSTKAGKTEITSFLNIKAERSDAVSINQIFLDEIKLTFDNKEKSFVISNETDLLLLSNYVNSTDNVCEGANFKLNADLDMRNRDFEPIGISYRFGGHFDGQGHTISNLSCSTDSKTVGLFGTLGNNSIVEKVTLINPELRGSVYAGGITVSLIDGTIQNCIVVGGTISGNDAVGGIVGWKHSDTSAKISNCTVVGTTISGSEMVGCIVGRNSAPKSLLKIYDCIYDASCNKNICGFGECTASGNQPVYHLNLGYGITSSDVLTFSNYTVAKENASITLNASREGYEFGGFNSDDVTIENGQFTMPDKSVSVTAKWEAKNEISPKASMIDGLCWSTFYCGDAGYRIADGEEACAYTATVSDDKIILHMFGRVIPKGTAVIIVGEDNSISMTRDDVSAAEYSAVNDLNGVDLPTARTSLTSNDSYRLYMLSNKNNNFGFHSFAAANVPARKAFFTVPASANARSFSMVFDEETTAIRQLRKTVAESPVYDLDGRVVRGNNLKPGVYVKNGKKVVVK